MPDIRRQIELLADRDSDRAGRTSSRMRTPVVSEPQTAVASAAANPDDDRRALLRRFRRLGAPLVQRPSPTRRVNVGHDGLGKRIPNRG